MPTVFEETTINGMRLANRLVRSATWEGMCAADGRPSERLAALYRDLARGGVGLIITGYAFVRPDGKQLPSKMGIHDDDFEPEMRALVRAVHAEGGTICVQLVHAGGQTDARAAGRQPWAPSVVASPQFPELPAALPREEIAALVEAFGQAARRARAWGFDAVQLHGAHGYLINQFLSPLTNLRADEYGGALFNRARFLMEVYRRVRAEVGDAFPVLIKLNASDNLDGGLGLEDSLAAARLLEAEGIDAIEISAGTSASRGENPTRTKIDDPAKEGYNLPLARRFREALACPLMVVGGFRSFAVVERAIREDGIDYVAMARPFIREPDLARRWQSDDLGPARCVSCSGCFRPGLKEGGIYCVTERRERERAAAP